MPKVALWERHMEEGGREWWLEGGILTGREKYAGRHHPTVMLTVRERRRIRTEEAGPFAVR